MNPGPLGRVLQVRDAVHSGVLPAAGGAAAGRGGDAANQVLQLGGGHRPAALLVHPHLHRPGHRALQVRLLRCVHSPPVKRVLGGARSPPARFWGGTHLPFCTAAWLRPWQCVHVGITAFCLGFGQMAMLVRRCRDMLLEFYAASGDFTRRLTSIKANSKFAFPEAGPEDYFSVRCSTSVCACPLHHPRLTSAAN